MSNLAIVSTPFVLLDLYGVTVTYSEMGKQKRGGAHNGKEDIFQSNISLHLTIKHFNV